MAGDRDRAALSGERGGRIVTGPLAERVEVGALHHDVAAPERGDADAADGLAGPGPVPLEHGQLGQSPAGIPDRRHQRLLPQDHAARLPVQLVSQAALLLGREERRDRFLPRQRESGVGQHEDPARDQHRRHEAEHWANPSGSGAHVSSSVRSRTGVSAG